MGVYPPVTQPPQRLNRVTAMQDDGMFYGLFYSGARGTSFSVTCRVSLPSGRIPMVIITGRVEYGQVFNPE